MALVEFVLVAPVLLVLVFAIVDFGRALNYRQQAAHLTSEGARYASVNKCPTGSPTGTCLQQYLRNNASSDELKNGSASVTKRLSICLDYPGTGPNANEPVRLRAEFDFQWLPILNLAKSTITASSTMRLETASTLSAGCVS